MGAEGEVGTGAEGSWEEGVMGGWERVAGRDRGVGG